MALIVAYSAQPAHVHLIVANHAANQKAGDRRAIIE